MPLAMTKKAKDAKAVATVRRTPGKRAGWSLLHALPGHVLVALAALWRWLGPPRNETLLPYVRSRRVGRLGRTAIVLLTIVFCFVYGFAFGLFAPYLIGLFFIPPVIMVLLVIWALPDVKRAPIDLLEGLFLAFVLTMLLWPNYLAMSIPGLPRITFLRLVGTPMAVCLMVCISTSPIFREQLSAALKNSRLLWRTILLFASIQTISIVFSTEKGASINIYFNMLLSWYAVFFISSYIFSKRGMAQRFAFVIWGTAVALGLLGLWENHLQALPWAGHIPSFLKINDPIVEKILAGTSRGGGRHRVQGPFTTSLAMAEYLALTMPFLLHFMVGRFQPWVRFASVATIPLVVTATVLCQARTGLLGLAIAFIAFPMALAVLYARRYRHSMLAWMTLYLSPLAAFLAIVVALLIPAIRIRLLGGGAEQYSTNARYQQWHMGMPKILAHPWGYGVGRGGETVGYLTPEGFPSIDSYPLRLVVEYGVIGIAVYYAYALAALFYVGRNTWKGDPDHNHATLYIACGVCVLAFTAMQINFAQEDNQSVMFIVYGMIVGLQFVGRRATAGAPAVARSSH